MAEETQYTSRNGVVVISTANSNLDGTGTLGTVITAAANGTLIKTVYIKAQTNTSDGMVRLFIDNGSNIRLLKEVHVPAVTKGSNVPAFAAELNLDMALAAGYTLKASTQNANTFGIVVEAVDWIYTKNRSDTTEYIAGTGAANLSTANTHLDGSGTLVLICQHSNANGLSLESINIKALQSTTPGMIRLFLQNSGASAIALFKEIPVPAITASGKVPAFEYTLEFDDDFEQESNYTMYASTEKGENFRVFVDAMIRTYAP